MRSSDWSSDVCSSDLPGRGSDLFLVDLDDDVAGLEPLLGAGAAVLHLGDNHALGRLVEGEAVAQFRRDGAERKAERLQVLRIGLRRGRGGRGRGQLLVLQLANGPPHLLLSVEIGRESCRERMCQYV